MARALVGTSGWVYPHWRGWFYPPELPSRKWLAFLAERLATVEINASFYRLQRPECFARWRAEVPPGFVFAVKGSRYITHMRRLDCGRAPLANFFAQGLLLLGAQLGPILWQLPPRFRFDAERAARFFDALPLDLAAAERLARSHDDRLNDRAVSTAPDGRDLRLRHALEVRDPSWLADDALELLIERNIALVTADAAGRHPFNLARTADFAYLRLHGAERLYGGSYTDAQLDFWAERATDALATGADAFVYFDNDERGFAAHNALALASRLHGSRAQRNPMSTSR